MQRFEGKVAVVTGAASGIGRATVARLVDEGAQVVAVDVQPIDAAERVRPIGGDVTDPALAEQVVAAAVDSYGRLDVLVAVAGILRTARTHEHPLDVWQKVLDVNLTGTFSF